jgi:CDGSH-type Zn-finger protein
MTELTIRTKEHGPYLVTGPFTLTDHDGGRYEVEAGKTVALCRCGGSQNKPFCDATHSKLGFEAAERAVARAEGETG